MRGSLHCGFAFGRDDEGWVGVEERATAKARAEARCGGLSTAASPSVEMTRVGGGWKSEQQKRQGQRRDAGVSPLRSASVEMTRVGLGWKSEQQQKQEQRRDA